MNTAQQIKDEQATLWNGTAGQAWIESQELLDRMFKPFEELLVTAVSERRASRVLDVGCGTGSTTLAIARSVGTQGCSVGIDISDPMIGMARTRASREHSTASFICADAQDHAFEPAAFDLIVSRFGVMFFADPVEAFANLRLAGNDAAQLHCIAWRSVAENPFMTTAERAAASLLPTLPARRPDGPGQFAFADQRKVHGILEDSGWVGIDIRPIDVICTMMTNELDHYLTRLGPVGQMLQTADDRTRSQIAQKVRAAFEPYVHGPEVRFTAACWSIGARAAK